MPRSCASCGAFAPHAFCPSCGAPQTRPGAEEKTPPAADGAAPVGRPVGRDWRSALAPTISGLRDSARGMTPMRRSLSITGAVLLLGALVGGAVLVDRVSEPLMMSGNFTLANVRESCDPPGALGAYSDISEGVSVTVYDADGSIAGVGALGSGSWESSFASGIGNCTFPLEVDDLSRSTAYQVEVGHRGKVTVSPDELDFVAIGLD